MGRHEMRLEETIHADVDDVWQTVSDVNEIPKWFPSCRSAELLDAEAPAPGVRRVLHLDIRGKDVRSEQEITVWQPKTSIGWIHVLDSVNGEPFTMIDEASLHFRLDPADGGTKITAVAEWKTRGLKAMLAAPLVNKVVAHQTKECLANLRRMLEKPPQT